VRVIFVTSRINLATGGGSNYSLHLTASELARRHDVHVLSMYGGEGAPDASAVPYRMTQLGWHGGARLAQMRMIRSVLERYAGEADVFHLYEPHLALGGGLYKARGGRVPVVATLNNYQLFCTDLDRIDGQCHRGCNIVTRVRHAPGSLPHRLAAAPLKLYDQVIGFPQVARLDRLLPDSPVVEQIYREAGFDMTRSTVIPEVVDFGAMRQAACGPAADHAAGHRDSPWQLMFAGRLVDGKGADVLIDAVSRMVVPLHLHIAGIGPAEEALRRQITDLGLTERVTLHGWVANERLWSMYREAHLFVHPGRWPEPCGRTILEAMALGVPVVTTAIGGPPWLLDGMGGGTCAPGSAEDLARAIGDCLGDYAQACERAGRAQGRAEEFDVRCVVPRLEAVYEAVCAPAPLPAAARRPAAQGARSPHPKVSVVIPCYNGAGFLERCLRSIAALDAARDGTYEVVVVDDGSTEVIRGVVERFGAFARYVRQENQGPAAARNTGIARASGEYVRFLDADDYLVDRSGLRAQEEVLDRYPEVGLVYAQAIKVDTSGRPIGIRRPPFATKGYVRGGDVELTDLLSYNYITTSSTIIRRSIFERAGPFRTDLFAGEDWDFWLRVARVAGVAYVAEPVVAYRVHESSITARYSAEGWLRMHEDILDRLFADSKMSERYAPARQDAYARLHGRAAMIAFLEGREALARGYGMKAVRHSVSKGDWGDAASTVWLLTKTLIPPPVRRRLRSARHAQRVVATRVRLMLRRRVSNAVGDATGPLLERPSASVIRGVAARPALESR